jgi:predicted amidohydrolase YtcJ
LAGISEISEDPEGGIISKTKEGKPNGLLHESAGNLVFKIAPRASMEMKLNGLEIGIRTMLECGITSFQVTGLFSS